MRRHLFCIIVLVLRLQRVFCTSLPLSAIVFIFGRRNRKQKHRSFCGHQPQVAETESQRTSFSGVNAASLQSSELMR